MGFLVLSARFWPGSATGGRRCAGAPSWGARRQPCLPGRFFPSRGGERKSARRAGHGRSPRRRARDPLAAGRGYRVGMEGPVGPGPDAGLFGPDSVSWRVLRESSVVVGRLRALLMHAAHPLVVAGARQTGMYERDPWRRLERTLRQTFTVVFGTHLEAEQAAKRIDDVHGAIKGIDEVTGLRYDARDPDLLLWVHACVVSGFLEMERRTLGKLDDAVRQRFHEEQKLALRAVCWTMRHDRPLMPPRWRFIAPALAAGARLRGENASVSGAGLFLRGAGWRVPRPRLDHAGSRQPR